MKPASCKKIWQELRHNPDKERLGHLARRIALSFEDRYYYNDQFEDEYIGLLCEMATAFECEELNAQASSALFGIIIEGLCDDFEELQTEAYNRVMSLIVSYYRGSPGGLELDRKLREYGLQSFADIYARAERVRKSSDRYRPPPVPPRRIILLSRVTIGADVAVTSVMLQRLHREFPEAEIFLLGGGKLKSLFGNCEFVKIKEVGYRRRGGLADRFGSWHLILEAIREIAGDDASDAKTLLFDPDSRLSQLGVLPLVADSRYYFFNSRGNDSYPKKISIAELTNYWLDQVLGEAQFCYPKVWLNEGDTSIAENFTRKLREAGCKHIVSVNFGVGGNARKRVSTNFEAGLLARLVAEEDTVVLLDKGFGPGEVENADRLLQQLRQKGFRAIDCGLDGHGDLPVRNGIVGLQSSLGRNAALIMHSDEFIGYDSAFQHIAAALNVATHTIFAGSNNVRFVRRWRPCNSCSGQIVHVDTLTHPAMFDDYDIVERVLEARDG